MRFMVDLVSKKAGGSTRPTPSYTRVPGEIRKWTGRKGSRQSGANVMREHGFDPRPKRREQTWDGFVRSRAATLWQCDFFSTRVMRWCEFFLVVFLHVGTGRVFVTPATAHPTAEWVEEQARTFNRHLEQSGLPCGQLFRWDFDALI